MKKSVRREEQKDDVDYLRERRDMGMTRKGKRKGKYSGSHR